MKHFIKTSNTISIISYNRMSNGWKMDAYLMSESVSGMDTASQADALPQIMAAIVSAAQISQDQADSFLAVHNRLIEAGLMQ